MAAEAPSRASEGRRSPTSEKRKSIDEPQEQPTLEGGPATKKQKLPVRGKGVSSGNSRFVSSLEIPVPRLSKRARAVEEIEDSQDDGDDDDGGDEDGSISAGEEVFKTPLERKHIVFDDDDHEEFLTPLERPLKHGLDSNAAVPARPGTEGNLDDNEEEDDDDDAPPEAVSSHQAAAKSLEIAQAAAKAAEKQAAAKKRKRQERDLLFKAQAEARKRTSALDAQDGGEGSADAAPRPETQRRKKKLEVPDVLPLELLESDDDEEPVQTELTEGRRHKKIRFDAEERLSREVAAPRDRRVGTTVYRVLADKSDGLLAPKAGRQAKITRQQLMVRKRAPVRKGSFFVKR